MHSGLVEWSKNFVFLRGKIKMICTDFRCSGELRIFRTPDHHICPHLSELTATPTIAKTVAWLYFRDGRP